MSFPQSVPTDTVSLRSVMEPRNLWDGHCTPVSLMEQCIRSGYDINDCSGDEEDQTRKELG